jgi:hypothetical protein
LLALGLLWLGVVGFASPNPLGLHLTPVHNIIHLATGFVAFCVGFGAGIRTIRGLGLVFGVAYTAFGLLGVVLPSVVGTILADAPDLHAAALLPDNLLSVFLGSAFLFSAFAQARAADLRRSYL